MVLSRSAEGKPRGFATAGEVPFGRGCVKLNIVPVVEVEVETACTAAVLGGLPDPAACNSERVGDDGDPVPAELEATGECKLTNWLP